MREKKISVIIPSFNSVLTIERTFQALNTQAKRYLMSEIIVVDSSNDQCSKKILYKYQSNGIKIINAGIMVAPAISRNIGAKYAGGEILAFIDSDAYPAHNWLENIETAYASGCMAGGGSIEMAGFQKKTAIAMAQYYLQFNEYMNGGKRRIKKFVTSCNMFCDRELFLKSGGFPRLRAAEDVLFGLNIGKAAPLWFVPKARVSHIFSENRRIFLKKQMLLGRYIYIYRKKYYGGLLYKRAAALVLFPAFFCIKLIRMTARIFQAGTNHIYHFIIAAPLFMLGLLYWSIGFIKEVFNAGTNSHDI